MPSITELNLEPYLKVSFLDYTTKDLMGELPFAELALPHHSNPLSDSPKETINPNIVQAGGK